MPAADARSAKVRARKAPGDLCTHDIGRDRLGRCRTESLRERQECGNDRGGRLTADISEIVVHRVRGDAIGERGKLRRRAQRLPHDRRLRRASFVLHHFDGEMRHLLVAAGEHDADRIDEGDAGAVGRRRGALLRSKSAM
jgi:hypothetical protein